MEFFTRGLLCLTLLLAISITSSLRVRPIDSDSPVITVIGSTRDVTSSSCQFIHEPNATYNVSFGSGLNFTVITVNCTAIFLNDSGRIIAASSASFSQFDPKSNETGGISDYIEGVYTVSNITLANDGDTVQFFANGLNGGDFVYSRVATIRVQGPPDPVTDLSCYFLIQDLLHVSFNEPHTLLGVKTSYVVEPYDLSEAFTTDNSKVNVTMSNITSLDKYKAYNITVTSFNAGSMGTASNCTVFIPNATQIAATVISIAIVNRGNGAIMNLMTTLLNTTDKPLCPGCYPETVQMFINFSNGHIKQYEFSVPPGQTTFHEKNISVQKNAVLSGDIYYCNVAECVKSTLGQLSTFDLQFVQLKSADNGSVCLECTFTNGSLADGCIVELHFSTDEILELIASAERDNLITTECYTKNALTSNESYYWEAYALSLSNESPFKLSSKPALTGVLTIPIKASPTTELPTWTTSASPSTELPTSGPHHYEPIIYIGLVIIIFILVCALLAVFVVLLIVKKSPVQRCGGRYQVQGNEGGLVQPADEPPSYQPRVDLPLVTILEDTEVEPHPVNEQEECSNVTVLPTVQPTTYKPRKRPASISFSPFIVNTEVPLSPHAASQPTTPNVATPAQFSFQCPPGPTRNSSYPQLPPPPS